MILRFSTFLLLALFITTGCKDSSTDSNSNGDASGNGLAVRAVSTGTGDLEISTDSEAKTNFCYESDGCETMGSQSFHTVYEDSEALIDYSNVEGKAVGVKVGFHVDAGSGYFEIVSGNTYKDDAGFLEFEEGQVLYTSDTEFSEGDIVTYSYGETD